MPLTTHGSCGTPEYYVWGNMIQRCTNPNHPMYKHYGGRGIKVDPRWLSFETFLADMGPRPSPDHSIERREVDGDYEPSNCYWATSDVQANNRQDNIWVEYQGAKYTITQLARKVGISSSTVLTDRLKRTGGDVEAAVDPARWPKQLYEYEGEKLTLRGWSERTGIPYATLYGRIVVRKLPLDVAFRK